MNKSKSPTFFLLNFVLNRLKLFSGTSVHNVLFIQNIKETLLQSFWDKSFCNPINLLINVTVNTPYFPRLIEITSWWRRKWSTSLEFIWVVLSSHWIRTWSGSLQELLYKLFIKNFYYVLDLLFKTRKCVLSFMFHWSLSINVVCLIHLELYNPVNPRSLVISLDHHGRVQGSAPTKSCPPRGCFLLTRSNPSGVSSIPGLWGSPFDEYLPVIWSSLYVTIAGIVTRLLPFR